MECPASKQREAAALSHLSPQGSSRPVLWGSGITFLPVCMKRPCDSNVTVGCWFRLQVLCWPVSRDGSSWRPLLAGGDTGDRSTWCVSGASLCSPGVISASKGPVPSRMGQGRWQCLTCCSYLWWMVQPAHPEMLNALPNFSTHKPDYFVLI